MDGDQVGNRSQGTFEPTLPIMELSGVPASTPCEGLVPLSEISLPGTFLACLPHTYGNLSSDSLIGGHGR